MSIYYDFFSNSKEASGLNPFSSLNYYDNLGYENNQNEAIFEMDFGTSYKQENLKESQKDFYSSFGGDTQSKTDKHEHSSKNEECCEVASIVCENEYQEKVIENNDFQISTNSTIEADSFSDKSSKKSYNDLFIMIEDKSQYCIGSDEDELTPSNNKDLINIDNIIADSQTDLNNFIEDMLKNCPCDNLIKKQRIYKAKNIKRKRKTKSQIRILEKELLKNPVWIKEDFKRLSESLNLNRDQVYKWYWDQKKKSDF